MTGSAFSRHSRRQRNSRPHHDHPRLREVSRKNDKTAWRDDCSLFRETKQYSGGNRRRRRTTRSRTVAQMLCCSAIAMSNPAAVRAFGPIHTSTPSPTCLSRDRNHESVAFPRNNHHHGARRGRGTSTQPKIRNGPAPNERGLRRSTTSISVFVDTISAETTASALAAATDSPPLQELADYAPAAASLFNNMKLPAAVVTAGMISLGFATSFPELPRETPENRSIFPPEVRRRCDALNRLHVVVALIAVTSELIVVMWAAVEVNQLTEKQYALASSVWDLIERDADLAWSAVNSHFVLGIIGFVAMLTLRAYVMLLRAEASKELMTAASTGTGAALCLMISIVNRGVESGGGNGERYGSTILDLFQHYVVLLAQNATNDLSPGPLQFAALALETTSLVFMANVLLFQNGKAKYAESDTANSDTVEDDEECPVIDLVELEPPTNGDSGGPRKSMVMLIDRSASNKDNKIREKSQRATTSEPKVSRSGTKEGRQKIANCLTAMEDPEQAQEEEDRRREQDSDQSVNIL